MKKWAPWIGIFIFSLMCFGILSIFRFYHFGIHSENTTDLGFRINSEYTLSAIRTWLNKGFLGNKLTISLVESFPGIPDRSPYHSYPQGFVFVPYLIAKALNLSSVELSFLDAYSASIHFLFSCLLGFFTFCLLKKHSIAWALITSFALAAYGIFSGPMIIFFQNSYFSDQASLLPYLATLFLFHRYSLDPSKGYRLALMFCLFLGSWTDHSVLLLGVVSFFLLLLLWPSEKRKELILTFALPMGLSTFLFTLPVFLAERRYLYYFFLKFQNRNGVFGPFPSPWGAKSYLDFFGWIKDFSDFQGTVANAVMLFNLTIGLLTFGYVLWRRASGAYRNILILSTVPLALHSMVFLQHYYLHPYNVVRAIIPVAIPLVIYIGIFLSWKKAKIGLTLSLATILVLPISILASLNSVSLVYLNTRHLSPIVQNSANLVHRESRPGDLFVNTMGRDFSNSFGIYRRWYQEINNAEDVLGLVSFLKKEKLKQPPFQVAVLANAKDQNFWQKAFPLAKASQSEFVTLWLIPVSHFLEGCEKLPKEDLLKMITKGLPGVQERSDLELIARYEKAPTVERIHFLWMRSWERLRAELTGRG